MLGLACLACQGSSGSGSWTVSKEQERSPEPLCQGTSVEARGGINGTFVWPGAEEHMAQARSVPPDPLPLPFLGLLRLSTAPALPPSEESLPAFNQSLACPHPLSEESAPGTSLALGPPLRLPS